MASMQDCITNCLDCHSVCLATIVHCLEKAVPMPRLSTFG